MDGYLPKPIRPQELDEIPEGYLARRSAPAKTEEIAGTTQMNAVALGLTLRAKSGDTQCWIPDCVKTA